jgi:hypothetical protein
VRKTTGLMGAVAIGSGLIATGAPAYADSTNNNGVNLLDGNNVSVLPIQLCPGSSGILSDIVKVGSGSALSPQTTNCVNAPIIDHPRAAPAPQRSAPASLGSAPATTRSMPVPTERAAQLPLAPEPVAVLEHHAVTG